MVSWKLATSVVALSISLGLSGLAAGQTRPLSDGWKPYEKGFTLLAHQGKSGGDVFYCESRSQDDPHGAVYALELNQRAPSPFMITAWSRCQDVNAIADSDYSLYLDLTYTDGGHLWGSVAPFEGGTHGWQRRQVRILPDKPVREALVYLLLRHHTGKAWFSDVTLADIGGQGSFDYQPIAPPIVHGEGWFVRDVAADSKVLPISAASSLGLKAIAGKSGVVVRDLRGKDRAITIYFCKRLELSHPRWWTSIRTSKPAEGSECANLTSVSSGANGLSTLYPFAAVTDGRSGAMLGLPPSIGPRIARLFYDPEAHLLCAAFDVALSARNRAHPRAASAEVMERPIDPAWGFRDAARLYYAAYPDAFKNRIARHGIWIPFTDTSTVPHAEDFGIAVHEGDNSVAADARLGILSFRYTEPMTWWMDMDPSIPRTYANALKVLDLDRHEARFRKSAEVVVTSASMAANGQYNVAFDNEPWANGAVWILNPNPLLRARSGLARQADIDFDLDEAEKRYATTALSGEYLDSLEAHEEVLDYRPESLAASTLPPSFDTETMRPLVPQSYSTYELTKEMSGWLHAHGKLLMANTTPVNTFGYMPLLDCAGIEVNWHEGGQWTPDTDDVFCYRRTLSYHKLYMLLQNTDFSTFSSEQVALYVQRCLFYDVYPSFFSANAATNVYWADPKLYNRDRALFKKTIPLFRRLSDAGWEPVTYARTSDPSILIERYGDRMWTVYNTAGDPRRFGVSFDRPARAGQVTELVTGARLPLSRIGGKLSAECTLEPGECGLLSVN